jgi:two-component system, NtrC family, sensor histidine kinase HydH
MLGRMDRQRLDEVRQCYRIDAATTRALQNLYGIVEADIPNIIDVFCDRVTHDPEVTRRSKGEERDLHCLKQSLIGWLRSALTGPHDGNAYFESRRRIGEVHVQIELPQELMLMAMNCVRESLLTTALSSIAEPERLRTTVSAVNRVLDLELTLILDSYRDQQQRKLKSNERLVTIGQLAASIGHELRNPLGTIETSVYLIAQKLDRLGVNDEGTDRHIQKARKQVQLCSKIISDLLELARSRTPTRRQLSVETVIDEALEALTWPLAVTRNKSINGQLSVYADPEQLRSVLVNLMENARDAIQSDGSLEIEASSSNDGVAIRIRDSGPGIAPSDQSRVFEPLYTTKAHGNGLGLALCRRIVAAHGGTIELESVAAGASFRVWLPNEEIETAALT